ncbi:endothelin-converting enzyme 1 [Xylariaceae sp. FL0016]|nr:endothelin-converting enzyme 1 [Xylariaceae sp. FL0016]
MADQSQTTRVASNERTPLLHNPAVDDNGNGSDDRMRDGSSDEDFTRLNRQIKTWRRRRWISLIVSAFLIVAFVVILILSGVLSRKGRKSKMNTSTCTTPACIHAASEILYNLSPDYKTIDPCTSFDTLVCDGFNARYDIPSDSSSYSTSTLMSDNGKTALRHILESPYPNASQHSSFSPMNLVRIAASTDEDNFLTMQEAYNACMDESTIKEVGVEPLRNLISKISKSFPVAEGSYRDDEPLSPQDYASLTNTTVMLEKMQVSWFEGLYVGADDKNPDVVIVQAFPSGLSLPSPEYYQDNDTVKNYQSMLEEVFGALLPSNSSRAASAKISQSVIDFEKKIADITPPPEDQQDVTKYYNIIKIADAGKIAPAIELDAVIKSMIPSDYSADTMLLAFPEFLGNVSEIISKTPKSTVQSYMIWQLINAYYSYIEAAEVQPIGRFYNVLSGRDPETKSERWKTCLNYVDNTIGWILSRFYIEAAFSEDAKKFGDQIVMDIKQQFISKLSGLEWMDDSVKKLATNKVNNIDQKIGYPTASPDIMNPDALRDYYNGLAITKSFFNNSISSNTWSVNRTWSALGKPVDHGEWGMQADIVNAYYNPVGNEIVFPAGIMQFPVFHVELPGYVSYGAFASVAGHELSHAFDNSGRHYDEHGNYTDWWTNHTVEEFGKRADCFVNQYNNFTVEGSNGQPLHVNGRLTLGENIADAGGVSAAFAAWQKRLQSTPDENLPGLDHFTQEQLFFVFYANWWCGKTRKESAINRIYTDPHSPAFARILGTMANSRAFRDSFNCPAKEPTCELW